MYRSIHRSLLDRHSTDTSVDCRPRVDRCFSGNSTDVGRGIDRDRIGSLSVNYRRNIDHLSAECQSCIIRQSSESLPIGTCILSNAPVSRHIGRHMGRLSTVTIGRVSVDISAEYRPTYRPIVHRYLADNVGGHIGRHVDNDLAVMSNTLRIFQ